LETKRGQKQVEPVRLGAIGGGRPENEELIIARGTKSVVHWKRLSGKKRRIKKYLHSNKEKRTVGGKERVKVANSLRGRQSSIKSDYGSNREEVRTCAASRELRRKHEEIPYRKPVKRKQWQFSGPEICYAGVCLRGPAEQLVTTIVLRKKGTTKEEEL